MNDNASPLSLKEQIEVLEAAKVSLVALSIGPSCIGLCCAISCVIYEDYNHLVEYTRAGIYNVIPSFTFDNAVQHGNVDNDAAPDWFWWDTNIEKGGITNRLKFLDYLIEKLKNEDHE